MTRSERKTLEAVNRAERANRRPVAIVNTVTGGRSHISPERAAEHVAAGIAAYRRGPGGGLAIEFVGHRHEAAALTAARQARNLDSAVSTGVASHDMIAAIPVVRPADLIGPSPRRNSGWKSCVWKSRSTRPTDASGRPL